MSGKVKIRCARCGKPFKSANPKQTLCAECEAKERVARAAGKGAAAKPAIASPVLVPKPKIVGAGARILDPTLPEAPEPPPEAIDRERTLDRHQDRSHADAGLTSSTERTPQQSQGAPSHQPATGDGPTGQRKGKPQRSPVARDAHAPKRAKAPRSPREPQKPVELSPEQREAVETRYLELAVPVEYDGIRTQIAAELGVLKSAVKKAVVELRQRMQMPSWWELQAYKGSESDLERIRQAYAPHLPLPEVGIHRRLASELGLDQTVVYQAIRRIRAEMRLPQYNPPELHEPRAAKPAGVVAKPEEIEEIENRR